MLTRSVHLMSAFFTGENVKDYTGATSSDTKAYADYFNYMLENGIYVAPSQFEAMFYFCSSF